MKRITFSDFWKGLLNPAEKNLIRQIAIDNDMTLRETINKWWPEYWDKWFEEGK